MSPGEDAGAPDATKLAASRTRLVVADDEARRRLHREVHDGPQQRLVHAGIALTMARGTVAPGSEAAALVDEALTNVRAASSELREVLRRIMPGSLVHGGLRTGLESLVVDLSLPVEVHVTTPRLPPVVETTAYLVVAEALTNVVAHAQARRVVLEVAFDDDTLVVEVRDDGVGGADPAAGTGLTGMGDRVAAATGSLTITSPVGEGTTVRAELPARARGDVGTQPWI